MCVKSNDKFVTVKFVIITEKYITMILLQLQKKITSLQKKINIIVVMAL